MHVLQQRQQRPVTGIFLAEMLASLQEARELSCIEYSTNYVHEALETPQVQIGRRLGAILVKPILNYRNQRTQQQRSILQAPRLQVIDEETSAVLGIRQTRIDRYCKDATEQLIIKKNVVSRGHK